MRITVALKNLGTWKLQQQIGNKNTKWIIIDTLYLFIFISIFWFHILCMICLNRFDWFLFFSTLKVWCTSNFFFFFFINFSLGWVQLLQHCLTIEESVASAAAAIPHLLTTCTALLVSPQANTHSPPYLETVLLKLGLHSTDMGLTLIDSLLRKSSFLGQPGKYIHVM